MTTSPSSLLGCKELLGKLLCTDIIRWYYLLQPNHWNRNEQHTHFRSTLNFARNHEMRYGDGIYLFSHSLMVYKCNLHHLKMLMTPKNKESDQMHIDSIYKYCFRFRRLIIWLIERKLLIVININYTKYNLNELYNIKKEIIK